MGEGLLFFIHLINIKLYKLETVNTTCSFLFSFFPFAVNLCDKIKPRRAPGFCSTCDNHPLNFVNAATGVPYPDSFSELFEETARGISLDNTARRGRRALRDG